MPFFGRFGLLRMVTAGVFLSLPAGAAAFGLGEILSTSRLGDPLRLEIGIVSQSGNLPDAQCFHFKQPRNAEETPWLKKASLSIRKSHPQVLVVTSPNRINDPILRVGLVVGCGKDIQHDYNILPLSPISGIRASGEALPILGQSNLSLEINEPFENPEASLVKDKPQSRSSRGQKAPPQRLDRLTLSSGAKGDEVRLKLASNLDFLQVGGVNERQRELLRIEFSLLQSLYEQTVNQLESTEKLRQMETFIDEFEHQVSPDLKSAQTSEEVAPQDRSSEEPSLIAEAPLTNEKNTPSSALVEEAVPATVAEAATAPQTSGRSWWKTFGILFFIALFIGGWVFLKRSRGKRPQHQRRTSNVVLTPSGGPYYDDGLDDYFEEEKPKRVSAFSAEETEAVQSLEESTLSPLTSASELTLSQLSVGGSSIEEHFEANPVMELAEIMLSFGRVKGAAQALQEFIDSNPEESLKPWIRLMDVYRMASMRSEFERVAAELNQHFNVEIQLWDEMADESNLYEGVDAIEPAETLPIEWPKSNRKAASLEDAEHIADRIVALWPQKDCVEFLDQLLRSNRGGLRSGFSRSVVEEIMFLIELQAEIEKTGAVSNA